MATKEFNYHGYVTPGFTSSMVGGPDEQGREFIYTDWVNAGEGSGSVIWVKDESDLQALGEDAKERAFYITELSNPPRIYYYNRQAGPNPEDHFWQCVNSTIIMVESEEQIPEVGLPGNIYIRKDTGLMYAYWDGSWHCLNTPVHDKDNVIFADSESDFPTVGLTNTIYISLSTNLMYIYNYNKYICINEKGTPTGHEVIVKETRTDFPPVGDEGVLYLAKDTDTMYYYIKTYKDDEKIGWHKLNEFKLIQCNIDLE